jgi:hypothetical protein
MFTPPGGGTNEGANDDTSGSTVSLEMAQALAQMEFDHTVVAGLWACEEKGCWVLRLTLTICQKMSQCAHT